MKVGPTKSVNADVKSSALLQKDKYEKQGYR